MAANFVDIPAGLVELYMMQMSALEVDLRGVKERVYERDVVAATSGKQTPYKLRIYSSINKKDDSCRISGKDSMKVCVVHTKSNMILYSKRVNRCSADNDPKTIMERFLEKARSAYKWALTAPNIECECGRGVYVLRTAKRGKNSGNKFYGCSAFRSHGCKNTKPEDWLHEVDDFDEDQQQAYYEEIYWKNKFAEREAEQERAAYEAKMKSGW